MIPDLLEALLASGTKLKDELRWQKASTWVLTWDGEQLAKGQYLLPARLTTAAQGAVVVVARGRRRSRPAGYR